MIDDFDSISASPLHWPVGWKRTKSPVRSNFSKRTGTYQRRDVTINEGIRFVLGELFRMGIPDYQVIISSNLRLRGDGLPISSQRTPEDVGVSVWWRDGPSHKVIALDKYDRVADNLHAVGKTIEAMRGIERWGSGEILERTFAGFEALPNPASANWRDVLGYDGEDYEECKAIYRRKIRESHPDNGGDASAAAAINDAWAQAEKVLSRQGQRTQ